MVDPLELAESIRNACMRAAVEAYEEAGISGLCQEGRWEFALQAMSNLDLQLLIDKLGNKTMI